MFSSLPRSICCRAAEFWTDKGVSFSSVVQIYTSHREYSSPEASPYKGVPSSRDRAFTDEKVKSFDCDKVTRLIRLNIHSQCSIGNGKRFLPSKCGVQVSKQSNGGKVRKPFDHKLVCFHSCGGILESQGPVEGMISRLSKESTTIICTGFLVLPNLHFSTQKLDITRRGIYEDK